MTIPLFGLGQPPQPPKAWDNIPALKEAYTNVVVAANERANQRARPDKAGGITFGVDSDAKLAKAQAHWLDQLKANAQATGQLARTALADGSYFGQLEPSTGLPRVYVIADTCSPFPVSFNEAPASKRPQIDVPKLLKECQDLSYGPGNPAMDSLLKENAALKSELQSQREAVDGLIRMSHDLENRLAAAHSTVPTVTTPQTGLPPQTNDNGDLIRSIQEQTRQLRHIRDNLDRLGH